MRRITCRITLLLLCAVALVEYSFAVTAYPDPVRIFQPDGTRLTVILQGDERIRWARSPDGYTLIYNGKGVYEYAMINPAGDLLPSGVKARDFAERTQKDNLFLATVPKGLFYSHYQVNILKQAWKTMKSGGPQHNFLTKGNRKLLCILIGYSDKPFTKTRTDFQNLFNQVGYNVDGARGSVKDYFAESSYNQLTLTVDVAGPYTAKNTAEHYGANDSTGYDARARELVAEAIQMADNDVNYADYDNDGDGAADGVHVIFAGYAEEVGGGANCIWSHAWEIEPVTFDGISLSRYSCSSELRSFFGSGLTRIGSICHEFGHILGAPDFYDIDYETGGSFIGTGSWDLQGAGGWNAGGASPAHSNPYIKIYLYNWAPVKELNLQTILTIKDAGRFSDGFYRINTTTAGEYFLLENRQKVGFDASLPGHGLMIYHVHKNIADGYINATHPQMFYPVCANATRNPDGTKAGYGVINSGGCPFPGTGGKTSFTDETAPSQKSWAGAFTNKPVTNISEDIASKTITLCFKGCADMDNPATFTGNAVSTSQIDLVWTKNASASPVMVVFSFSPVFGKPEVGKAYSVGDQLQEGGTVIYTGDLTSFNHTGLASTTTYYYKAWSILAGNTYSTGITANATTFCGDISHFPYLQNFDGTAFPPGCWTTFIGTNGLGPSNNWVRTRIYTNNHSAGAAYLDYEYVELGVAQDWLVTPGIYVPAKGATSLRFFQRQGFIEDRHSTYSVRISATSQTDAASFSSIATYGEKTFSMNFSQESLDLSTWAGQKIYIAFVMEQNEGDRWAIDDVTITNEAIQNSPIDSLALVSLYNKCGGPAWIKKGNWLTGPVNAWEGVTVENGRVVELNLGDWYSSAGLTGPMPAELLNLSAIRSFTLQNNQLSGDLPDNWSTLPYLTEINLDLNKFSGPFPDSWKSLVNLKELGLSDNQITSLPDLTSLINLDYCYAQNNLLDFGHIEPNVGVAYGQFYYWPQAPVGSSDTLYKNPGDEVRLSVSSGGKNNLYQWYKNGEIIPDATSEVFIIQSYKQSDEGIYSCRITNSLAIMLALTSQPVTLQTSASVVPVIMKPEPSISVWPNPVSYNATVRYSLNTDQQVTIQIIDCAGRVVEEIAAGAQTRGDHLADWYAASLEPGVYHLRLKNSRSVSRIIVIER